MVFSVYDSGNLPRPAASVFTSKNSTDTIYSDSLLFRVNTGRDTTWPFKTDLAIIWKFLTAIFGGCIMQVADCYCLLLQRPPSGICAKRKQQKAAAPVILRTKLSTYTLEQLQQLDETTLATRTDQELLFRIDRYSATLHRTTICFPAMERTSDEILKLGCLDRSTGMRSSAWLDMVKFGLSRPLPDQEQTGHGTGSTMGHRETTPDNEPEDPEEGQ